MRGTGLVESWTANPSELGPIYPFSGLEVLWLVVVIGFWLGWTRWQIRTEREEHESIARSVRATPDGRLRPGDRPRQST